MLRERQFIPYANLNKHRAACVRVRTLGRVAEVFSHPCCHWFCTGFLPVGVCRQCHGYGADHAGGWVFGWCGFDAGVAICCNAFQQELAGDGDARI